MNSVKEFFESLSGVRKDVFVSVATDLQASAPPEKIQRLSKFHDTLKAEIDRINHRREALGGVLNNIEVILKCLNEYTVKNGENFEIASFRSNLQKFAADLRVEIALSKPEKKLTKKFDVARKVESLIQRQTLSGHMFTEIIGGDTKPKESVIAKISSAPDELEEEEG
jgi:hypothetical protein